MEAFTKKIRRLIGDNELELAIAELDSYLDGKHQELADRVILQKRNYTAYRKKYIAGYGDEREAAAISDQLMEIVRDIDKWEKGGKKTAQPEEAQPVIKIEGELVGISDQPPAPPPPQRQYLARCVFYNDPNQYFVTPDNRIVAIAAMTGASMFIATKMPAFHPNIAWVYTFPNGIYYNVDMQGAIWGMNAFGQPVQMGYVEYFS